MCNSHWGFGFRVSGDISVLCRTVRPIPDRKRSQYDRTYQGDSIQILCLLEIYYV